MSSDHRNLPIIGRKVEVMGSRTPYAGIKGIVIDETMGTIAVRTDLGTKRVPKRGCVFRFDGGLVSGDDIEYRPEERLKKAKTQWKSKRSTHAVRKSSLQ